ncbi:MAG TPA: hypothetical protein VNO32_18225 [Candidatus Acidoferrum sp.]|nr:hypothetical protein [Candidatus Acidoferrum sp.]
MINRLIPSFGTGTLKLISNPNWGPDSVKVGESNCLKNKSKSVSGFESHYDLTFDQDIKAIATIQFGLVEKRYWLLPFELRWWIANSWPGHS